MRSNFVVHWTGRDIAMNRYSITAAQRLQYVDRLADIIQNGLWMTTPSEKIHGLNGSWIEYKAPMTCFTEIRLSAAEAHTQRYGLLGIGVTRHFILERYGGPVHYVRNHCTECVVANLQELLNAVKSHCQPEVQEYLGVNAAFVKAMSDKNTDNFLYLDEHEWRIVQTHRQVEIGNILKSESPPPAYRIRLRMEDVRVLVFPDDQTRTLAKCDARLCPSLQDPQVRVPVLLTLDECTHF